MLNQQTFEYPLNAKLRGYLKLEHLHHQIFRAAEKDCGMSLFQPLFGLYELCERIDYKNDLLKDLDKYLMLVTKWAQNPDIDPTKADFLRDELNMLKDKIKSMPVGYATFQNHKFLASIKQRLSVTGASCNFDLPQLHYWLSTNKNERQLQAYDWQLPFQPVTETVATLLKIIRNSEPYEINTAKDGFFQKIHESPIAMIRVKINEDSGCYPTISGHKNRFAIHMVHFESQKHYVNDTAFELACCSEP
jgi:cell division protein ZapD